ncbi:hypothetical protein [Phenylobacterium sp.]|uniref:hypothetical protein n=1 Tax=Phenylobacterium sp. TaxID=1871053 RepID=UPI00261C3B3E|nr:hypothetical protein [Phenylobacterium sp.]
MAVKAPPEDAQQIVSLALDAAFYRTIYADAPGAARDPLKHYVELGWREGRDPAPWFSTRRYLDAYPEIANARVDPFLHYLREGRREGRDVFPSDHAARYFTPQLRAGRAPAWSLEALFEPGSQAAPSAPRVSEEDQALAATDFDADFYRAANPDVGGDDTEALRHFLAHGWREGRDPNARFSVRDYLELYPDIEAAGINPFVHFLRAGRGEGRQPRHAMGFRYRILADLAPMEARIRGAAEASARVRAGSAAALRAALAASRTGLAGLHVTFSHDDYTATVGGVQACLQREAAAIADLGRDHLHVHPAAPWPLLRAGERAPLGLVWNGSAIGAYRPQTIAGVLRELVRKAPAGPKSFALHNLLGHAVGEVTAILDALGQRRGYFWLHDFASLCAGFHLMRNDVQDCAAPPPESSACGICVYGPWRARHLAEHRALFEALQLTVVSPSQTTLEFWRAAWAFPADREVVLPHARLKARGPALTGGAHPFRLVFPGLPAAHKGWPIFKELALRFEGDPRYEFLHLGALPARGLPIDFVETAVTAERPRAMRQALEASEADAALIWPLCRETFSFTAHEAVAAGAAVITNPDSGNVAAFVSSGRHGRILADEAALVAAFESGEILALTRGARKARLYDLAYSRMTAELLAAEAAP